MLTIRIPKAQWAKAWRAMIDVGPVRLIGDDPLYEVLPAHLEVLTARGFIYEVVPLRPPPRKKKPSKQKPSFFRPFVLGILVATAAPFLLPKASLSPAQPA